MQTMKLFTVSEMTYKGHSRSSAVSSFVRPLDQRPQK